MKNLLILFILSVLMLLITGCFNNDDSKIEKGGAMKRLTGKESIIKIYYQNGIGSYIHYSADGGNWTDVPGEEMMWISDDNPFNQYKRCYYIEIEATNLEFVFTDKDGQYWDNNKGQNYFIGKPGAYIVENGELKPAYDGVAFIEYKFEGLENKNEYLGKEAVLYKDGAFYSKIELGTFVNTSYLCTRITKLQNANYELELKIERNDGTMHFVRTFFSITDYSNSLNIMLDVNKYEMVKDKIIVYYYPKEIKWKHSHEGINIHYNADNKGWTNLSGINIMPKSYSKELNDRFSDILAKYEVEAESIEFCYNYLGTEWDNNNGINYKINSPGIYEVAYGQRIRQLPKEMVER